MGATSPRCIDNPDRSCLSSEYAWAIRLDDGRFPLPGGEVVDELG
jgi:hypothetical protein